MKSLQRLTLLFLAFSIAGLFARPLAAQNIPLDSARRLKARGIDVASVTYHGRKAFHVMSSTEADAAWATHPSGTGGGIVVVPDVVFHNGAIEVDVAGKPHTGAPADARGFVGIAFRVNADASKYEYTYIRPTNGRADDQVRRNHSAQYSSYPDYEWLRLRTEFPGKYESYVDLVPGEWLMQMASSTLKGIVNCLMKKQYRHGYTLKSNTPNASMSKKQGAGRSQPLLFRRRSAVDFRNSSGNRTHRSTIAE